MVSTSLGNTHMRVHDNPSFNPFADEDTTTLHLDSTTGIQPKQHLLCPPLRRRGSGSDSTNTSTNSSGSTSEISTNSSFKRHSRSQTEVHTSSTRSRCGSSSGHHPLRSAGLGMGRSDAGITRPHLTRMVGTLVDVPPVEEVVEENEVGPDEKVVLVHEISSSDSLAGVSLRYGINMTELRRFNHLWSSDSIHLRKVLYIPLDRTAHALDLTSDTTELPYTVGSSSSSESHDRPSLDGIRNGVATHSNSSASTIRRIPASQLSFFPPPSKPNALLPSRSYSPNPPNTQTSTHPYQTYSKHTHNTTSPSPSLSSLLTALPIAASTRDTIIARLSFDSVSSTYSDRDRERDEEGERHELDDVRIRERVMETPKARVRPSNMDRDKNLSSPPPSPTRSRSTAPSSALHSGHRRWESAPSLVYPEPQTPIRTVQLEPSPVMQLPFRSGARRSKARGSVRDIDFDLVGLGVGTVEEEIGP